MEVTIVNARIVLDLKLERFKLTSKINNIIENSDEYKRTLNGKVHADLDSPQQRNTVLKCSKEMGDQPAVPTEEVEAAPKSMKTVELLKYAGRKTLTIWAEIYTKYLRDKRISDDWNIYTQERQQGRYQELYTNKPSSNYKQNVHENH